MNDCLFCGVYAPGNLPLVENDDKNVKSSWSLSCLTSICAIFRIRPDDPLQKGLRDAPACIKCRQLVSDLDLSLRLLDKFLVQVEQYQEQLLEKVERNYARIRSNNDDFGNTKELVVCTARKFRKETAIINAGLERFKVLLNLSSLKKNEKNSTLYEDCVPLNFKQVHQQNELALIKNEQNEVFDGIAEVKAEVESICSDEGPLQCPDLDGMMDEHHPTENEDKKYLGMQEYFGEDDDEDEDDWNAWNPLEKSTFKLPKIPCPLCFVQCASIRGLAIHTRKMHTNPLSKDPDWDMKDTLQRREHKQIQSYNDDDYFGEEGSDGEGDREALKDDKNKPANNSTAIKDIPCSLCDVKCASARGLAIHTRKIHKKQQLSLFNASDWKTEEAEQIQEDDNKSSESGDEDGEKKSLENNEKETASTPTEIKDIPCSLCDVKCASTRELAIHTRKVHKKKQFPLPNDSDWKMEVTDQDQIKTEDDNKLSESEDEEEEEEEEWDESDLSEDTDNEDYNPTSYPSSKKKQPSKYTIPCTLCDIKFATTKGLAVHHRKIHEKDKVPEDNHPCSLCGLGFSTNELAQAHEVEHQSTVAPFTCIVCGVVTPNSSRLRKHVSRTHIKEPNHLCDICGLGLQSALSLKNHRKMHNESFTDFKCTVCDRIYPSKAGLVNHSYKHAETKSSICDICGKGFTYPASLTRHRASHDVEYAHKCKICGKAFSHKQFLFKHELIHSGTKTYACRYCDKKFKSSGNKWQHENLHCSNRPNKEVGYTVRKKKRSQDKQAVDPSPEVHVDGGNVSQSQTMNYGSDWVIGRNRFADQSRNSGIPIGLMHAQPGCFFP